MLTVILLTWLAFNAGIVAALLLAWIEGDA